MNKEQLIVELETVAEELRAIAAKTDSDVSFAINVTSKGYMDAACYVFDGDYVKAVPVRRRHWSYEGATWEACKEDACAEIN